MSIRFLTPSPSALGLGLLLILAPPARAGADHASLTDLPVDAQGAVAAGLGRNDGRYQASPTASGFATRNDRHGVRVEHRSGGPTILAGERALHLRLANMGRGEDLVPVAAARPWAEANRVEYRRDGLCEWYANGPLGLQQGFRIERRPEDDGKEPLVLELELSGSLAPRLDDGGLAFVAADGRVVPVARRLAGTDSRGRSLPTSTELADGRLRIRIDDRGAEYPIFADPLFKAPRLSASDGAGADVFGVSVAIAGDVIVVGAKEADVGPNQDQGSAYVFVRPAVGWRMAREAAKLVASDGAANDQFGISVAVSGDDVFVGSWNDDNTGLGGAGSVYVFTKPAGGWAGVIHQTARLIASDRQPGDTLGTSVAASGGILVAGAPFDDDPLNAQGSAYVFVRPAGGWVNTTQDAKLRASDAAATDRLGSAVAVSGDTIVVGAFLDDVGASDQGSVYVFESPEWTGLMTETAKLTASDGHGSSSFGYAVAVDGDTVVAGAILQTIGGLSRGAAYVFQKPASGWVSSAAFDARLSVAEGTNTDRLGESIAIVGDVIVAGARFGPGPFSADQGAAYVFVKPASGWATTTQFDEKLVAVDGLPSDNFGAAVARSGSVTVVGAWGHPLAGGPLQGQAYVYQP